MASRLLSFAVWAVVLASVSFWGLKVFDPRPPLPPQAQAPARSAPTVGDMSRLLGSSLVAAADEDEDEAAPESERFRLLGVVAPRGASHSAQGVALI
jgi:general secretion pathway protein C